MKLYLKIHINNVLLSHVLFAFPCMSFKEFHNTVRPSVTRIHGDRLEILVFLLKCVPD